jgi:hypothetical protein
VTIFLETPQPDTRASFAGGVGSFADIVAATYRSELYSNLSISARYTEEAAIDERIDEVFGLTGKRLVNTFRTGDVATIEDRRAAFMRQVEEATANIPDRTVADRAARSLEAEAIRIAQEAEAGFETLSTSRDGLGKWAAILVGGMGAALRDPLQVGALGLGGGPGAARTVGGRILTVAAKETAINGAAVAAIQPSVQAWREKAGLDHGVDVALQNVLFASLVGGAFGTAGGSAAEVLRPLLRAGDVDRAAAFAAADDRLAPELRAALAGDGLKAADSLAGIREALPPAARGAIDEAGKLTHLDASRPPDMGAEAHDLNATHADAAIADPAAEFKFEADPRRVTAIADELSPAPEAAPKRQDIVEFLIARGGVQDFNGELKAIGAGELTKNRARKGKRDRRMPLDYAREAAAEAGYLDHIYGDAASATARSTVADLADAIDQTQRGNRVFSSEDAFAAGVEADAGAARAGVESLLTEIMQLAGPAADDATVKKIAELAMREGLDAAQATERVLTAEGEAGPFGPILPAAQFTGDWQKAVRALSEKRSGEIPGLLSHPEIGAIDVVWGSHDPRTGKGVGLAHIIGKHPEVVDDLPEIVAGMSVVQRTENRIQLESPDHRGGVRLEYDGKAKTWLMTAFQKEESRRGGKTTDRPADRQEGGASPSSPAEDNIGPDGGGRNVEDFEPGSFEGEDLDITEADIAELEAEGLEIPFFDDGPPIGAAALRDELQRANDMGAVAAACRT